MVSTLVHRRLSVKRYEVFAEGCARMVYFGPDQRRQDTRVFHGQHPVDHGIFLSRAAVLKKFHMFIIMQSVSGYTGIHILHTNAPFDFRWHICETRIR